MGGLASVSGSSTAVTFAGTTNLTTTQDIASAFSLSSLTVAAGTGNLVINNNTLNFASGGTSSINHASNSALTVNSAVSLSSNTQYTYTGTSTGTTTGFSNIISGFGAFNVRGNGFAPSNSAVRTPSPATASFATARCGSSGATARPRPSIASMSSAARCTWTTPGGITTPVSPPI